MSQADSYTDVVELCAILQCLGFTVKSLDTSDGNCSQDGGTRTVVVNCQTSGIHVVLESAGLSCTCPPASEQNSGFWQVSGIAGGKHQNKETGSQLLGSLPKPYRQRLSKELQEMVRSIKEHNDSDMERPLNNSASILELGKNKSSSLLEMAKEGTNKSASMIELATPEKIHQLKVDTPSRCRSLDTLSAKIDLAVPRTLQEIADNNKNPALSHRQSTYTICSTPPSIRSRNKTSSPIQSAQTPVLESLIAAKEAAEELKSKLDDAISVVMEDGRRDSSISSLALDVSKISVLKVPETSKAQFASSPNLSGLFPKDSLTVSRLKRFESVSTSNLAQKSNEKSSKFTSKLRRISPCMLKSKKEYSLKEDKNSDGKSRLQGLFKPQKSTPIRATKPLSSEASPNLSASKKKFSHIKSTIPRPTPAPKKE